MTHGFDDPRRQVLAPLEHALDSVVLRAAFAFLAAGLAVLVSVLPIPEPWTTVSHVLLPALLALEVVDRVLRRGVRRRRPVVANPWETAADMEPAGARAAALLTVLVPATWLIGAVAIAVRHASDPDAMAAIVSLWGPLFLLLWLAATIAWAEDAADRVGLAVDESDRRFRGYWAAIARHDRD